MFVFVLFHCEAYCGGSFVGLFASLEAAKAEAMALYPEDAENWVLIPSNVYSMGRRTEVEGWYSNGYAVDAEPDEWCRIGKFVVQQ